MGSMVVLEACQDARHDYADSNGHGSLREQT